MAVCKLYGREKPALELARIVGRGGTSGIEIAAIQFGGLSSMWDINFNEMTTPNRASRPRQHLLEWSHRQGSRVTIFLTGIFWLPFHWEKGQVVTKSKISLQKLVLSLWAMSSRCAISY